ncbi:unnamed protein product [Protopolystoma xenopodis]|uniref:Uncharacterized protein n=1 Tax=Protopolystoma xenopodis TaxID=117903 RepID=A0A448WL17_9PLAT|nr:unnamed protein product [Protopolystoma xenopodis]
MCVLSEKYASIAGPWVIRGQSELYDVTAGRDHVIAIRTFCWIHQGCFPSTMRYKTTVPPVGCGRLAESTRLYCQALGSRMGRVVETTGLGSQVAWSASSALGKLRGRMGENFLRLLLPRSHKRGHHDGSQFVWPAPKVDATGLLTRDYPHDATSRCSYLLHFIGWLGEEVMIVRILRHFNPRLVGLPSLPVLAIYRSLLGRPSDPFSLSLSLSLSSPHCQSIQVDCSLDSHRHFPTLSTLGEVAGFKAWRPVRARGLIHTCSWDFAYRVTSDVHVCRLFHRS